MHLFSRIRQLFRPAPEAAVSVALPLSAAAVNQLFQQELLRAIRQHLPAWQPTLEEPGLRLRPGELTVETSVLDLTWHPNALVAGFGVRLRHPDHFPDGIVECLAGIGEDEATAAATAANTYTEGVLATVAEALAGQHEAALDLVSPLDGTVWHPLPGLLHVQGAWNARSHELTAEHFFQLFWPLLLEQLRPQPFHWVKLYASRQPSGEFVGECQLDNEPWEAGLHLLANEVAVWPEPGRFAGQKQFILLRRCGVCPPRSLVAALVS